MKKKDIFVNRIDKKLNNNQKSFDINENSIAIENDYINDKESVQDKLDSLFNRNGYTFNVDVKIKTSKKTYKTKIAGKVNNHIITLDNDIINIDDIIDIVFLN